jgi:hypothetical protein
MSERARTSLSDVIFRGTNDLGRAAASLVSVGSFRLSSELTSYLTSPHPDLPPPPPSSDIAYMLGTLLLTGIPAAYVGYWIANKQKEIRMHQRQKVQNQEFDRDKINELIKTARKNELSARMAQNLATSSNEEPENRSETSSKLGGFYNDNEEDVPDAILLQPQISTNSANSSGFQELSDTPLMPDRSHPVMSDDQPGYAVSLTLDQPLRLDFAQIYIEDPIGDYSGNEHVLDALDALQVPKAFFAHLPVAISEMDNVELELMSIIDAMTSHPEDFNPTEFVEATKQILNTLISHCRHRFNHFENSEEIVSELKFWLQMLN